VKDFIVLPFDEADGTFLTAVRQCPSFVTAGFPDGFDTQSALAEMPALALDTRIDVRHAPRLGDSVLRDQKQHGADLLVTGSCRQRQIDV
jgi:hypothetical protein